MKGYYCFAATAAAAKLGKMVVIVVLLLMAAISSFQPQGALGMRDSIGIRHRMYTVQGVAATKEVAFNKGANPDLNYGSAKRRVPNGSDPIHNRRAGKSGEPPAV